MIATEEAHTATTRTAPVVVSTSAREGGVTESMARAAGLLTLAGVHLIALVSIGPVAHRTIPHPRTGSVATQSGQNLVTSEKFSLGPALVAQN